MPAEHDAALNDAKAWLLHEHGDDLSGRQAESIVRTIGNILYPWIVIAIHAEMAESLRKTAPQVANTLDEVVREHRAERATHGQHRPSSLPPGDGAVASTG